MTRQRPSLSAIRVLPAILMLAGGLGCSRCSGPVGQNAERYVDQSAALVFSVPSLGAFADHVQAFLSSARGGPGGTELVQASANLARQLGFDPLTRDGLKSVGIDPSRPLAIGGVAGSVYAVIPYSDLSKLEETIARLAKDRVGAGVRESRTQGDVAETVLAQTAGGPPNFAYATKESFLILGMGSGCMASLATALALKPEQSVTTAGPFAAAKTKIGTRDAYLFMPKPPTLAIKGLESTIAAGIAIGPSELGIRTFLAVVPERQAVIARALVGGDSPVTELPAGWPVYLRGGIDWAAVTKDVSTTPTGGPGLDQLRELAKEAGIDFDTDIVGNMDPAFALGFSIAPTARIATALNLDPRRQNPFQNYMLAVRGRVKDGDKAKATLEKFVALLQKSQLEVTWREIEGGTLYTAKYSLGESISWALRGKEVLIIGGLAEHTDEIVKSFEKGESTLKSDAFTPRVREALFGKQGIAVSVDFGRINALVDTLPSDSFGQGPAAMMMKSMMAGVIQPLTRLHAALAVAPTEGGVMLDLAGNITEPAK